MDQDQSSVVNGRVASPTSPKIPPPLPPNPPRSLPSGSGRRTSASSSSTSSSQAVDKLPPQRDIDSTSDTTSRSPPPRPLPPDLPREKVSVCRTSTSPGAAVSGQTVLAVCLKSTPVRQPSGSLLGIGRRDAMQHGTEVKDANGTVYRRNASGVYFQVEQAWVSYDESAGLEVGDEVLAIDNYKMVDMSLDSAR